MVATETLTRPAPLVERTTTYEVVDAEETEETPFTIPPEAIPDEENIVTEDDTPVDNFASAKNQRLLVEPLYSAWSPPAPSTTFLADANVGVFFMVGEPPLVPDAFLSLDVQIAPNWWEKKNRTYFIWRFGKPPDVVVEIVSNSKGGEDSRKLRKYAEIGIDYYVIYDPMEILQNGVLRVYGLRDGVYQPLASGWLSQVGVGVTLWQGTYEGQEDTWLRWCWEDGTVIPTGKELAEQATQQAEQATQQAEQATQQAEQAQREKEDALQAKDEQLRTTARNLLSLLDDEHISQATGLSLEQVQALRAEAGNNHE
jgi:hypothetical protein